MTITGARPRPAPEVDNLTAPFWAAVAEGALNVQKCASCDRFIHAPLPICPSCHRAEFLRWDPVSGDGTVFSLTVVHSSRLPWFSEQEPYVVAMIELDEQQGLFMFGNLPLDDPATVGIGSRVSVYFDSVGDGLHLPQFRVTS